MSEEFISTKDLNEVARIHSNPKYANWRYEYVDGEYRFYSPNYKKQDTITFYHGGVEPDFDILKLDVLRNSQKQQNRNSSYVGFYMYSKENREAAIKYAMRENIIKNTDTKGVVKITMPSDIKVYNVPPFTITRITQEQIHQLQQEGYDVIAGSMLGKTEYVLLNKGKIIDMQFQPLIIKEEIAQETSIIQTKKAKEKIDELSFPLIQQNAKTPVSKKEENNVLSLDFYDFPEIEGDIQTNSNGKSR